MIPKFRAWQKFHKAMCEVVGMEFDKYDEFKIKSLTVVYPESYAWIRQIYTSYSADYNLFVDDEMCFELMQSTGLKDKNGVEIFEGDVLKGTQNLNNNFNTPKLIKGVVKFSKRNTMFYLEKSDYKDHSIFMNSLGNSIYQYEIIGNIYNNPELLTGA